MKTRTNERDETYAADAFSKMKEIGGLAPVKYWHTTIGVNLGCETEVCGVIVPAGHSFSISNNPNGRVTREPGKVTRA
jgi:hypothetical protein